MEQRSPDYTAGGVDAARLADAVPAERIGLR
jgi:hypothetical protein